MGTEKKSGENIVRMSGEEFTKQIQSQRPSVRMTREEAEEYVRSLLVSDEPPVSGMEVEILESLRSESAELVKADQKLQQVARELDGLRDRVKNMNGRCDGYANLLVKAELKRREASIRKAMDEAAAKTGKAGKPSGE